MNKPDRSSWTPSRPPPRATDSSSMRTPTRPVYYPPNPPPKNAYISSLSTFPKAKKKDQNSQTTEEVSSPSASSTHQSPTYTHSTHYSLRPPPRHSKVSSPSTPTHQYADGERRGERPLSLPVQSLDVLRERRWPRRRSLGRRTGWRGWRSTTRSRK